MKPLLHSFVSKTLLLVALLGSLIGSLAMARGETGDSFFVGAMNSAPANHRSHSAEGYLLVYSATDPFDDGDLVFNAHSSYSVYTTDGKLFKNVENHISRSDEVPELVTLPVGSYLVEARSETQGYVRVSVVIRTAQHTVLHLDK
jgi:hypothetical protein